LDIGSIRQRSVNVSPVDEVRYCIDLVRDAEVGIGSFEVAATMLASASAALVASLEVANV
jgi:hypothetical protein